MQPVGFVKDLGIRIKLRVLVGVAVAGLAVFAAVAFMTISEVRAGSPSFVHNRIASEVARDFANPSQELLSVYPLMFQSRMASGPADAERLRQLLQQAHARLEAGHQHYLQVLPLGRLRDLVTVEAYESAEPWFTIAEKEYMPAIERGDLEQADRIRRGKMEPLFQRNSAASQEVATLAAEWMAANRTDVAASVRSRTWQLAVAGLVTLVVQLLLGVIIDARVGSSTRHLQVTLEELRSKNAEVETFVYIVSHDLRAPLVNLQGFSRELQGSCLALKEIMMGLDLPEEVKTSTEQILNSDIKGSVHFITTATSRLERLIDSLLRFSREGRQGYKLKPINTPSLVQDALATLRTEVDQAGATIVIDDLPDFAGDSTALGLVFANLLSNALKYRDRSRPLVVRIGGRRENNLAYFWVCDNGVGIPAAGISRLFMIFQRLHPDLAPGEGMGLALVQRILERHRGRVWAESTVGEGTTIHFCVPVAKPSTLTTAFQELQNDSL